MGLSDGDCKRFPDEAAARAWMEGKNASEGGQAGGRFSELSHRKCSLYLLHGCQKRRPGSTDSWLAQRKRQLEVSWLSPAEVAHLAPMRRETMQHIDVLLPWNPEGAPIESPAKDFSIKRLKAQIDASARAGNTANPM